ncbi:MAG: hypothetical protein HQL70_09060 [Magnetococcales bacterium]|nr:hypothetical protein [Magnetococcales bacterium]
MGSIFCMAVITVRSSMMGSAAAADSQSVCAAIFRFQKQPPNQPHLKTSTGRWPVSL